MVAFQLNCIIHYPHYTAMLANVSFCCSQQWQACFNVIMKANCLGIADECLLVIYAEEGTIKLASILPFLEAFLTETNDVAIFEVF